MSRTDRQTAQAIIHALHAAFGRARVRRMLDLSPWELDTCSPRAVERVLALCEVYRDVERRQ